MTSTALGPLRKKLRRAYSIASIMQQESDAIVRVMEMADVDATDLEQRLALVEKAARQLIETVRIGAAKARELRELTPPPNEIADAELIAEGLDFLLSKLPPAQLARELEMVPLDTYLAAFQELSTYESGLERLVEIRDAAERVMQKRRGKGDG